MSQTVLIVEDSRLNMMLFCDLLEREGYVTLRAETGMKGIRLARAHRPDLILMDIKLPDFNGTEVIRWIKHDETLKDIPVMAVTALAMLGDREKILESGCDAYMAKPIGVPEFLAAIEKTISMNCLPRPSGPLLDDVNNVYTR